MNIRLAGILEESIVDGPGIRFVIFTQGCPHHCPGCHNPETHDYSGGTLVNINDLVQKFTKYPYMTGLTISGGEPFIQSCEILEIIKEFKKIYPKKNIMIFSGYKYEELINKNNSTINDILSLSDYLVDGKFILANRDISLHFKGSTNQRIIDLKQTYNNDNPLKNIIIKDF